MENEVGVLTDIKCCVCFAQFGTDELDGANFVTIVNETVASTVEEETDTMAQVLYVVGWTWGYLDEGGHALNGFGHFGGRDVVLFKMTLDGEKMWIRQVCIGVYFSITESLC